MHFTKVQGNMILLHRYGKRVIQMTGARLASSATTFPLRAYIWLLPAHTLKSQYSVAKCSTRTYVTEASKISKVV